MNTEGFCAGTILHTVQHHDLLAVNVGRDVAVDDTLSLGSQGCQLVKVCGKETHTADLRHDVLRDRPGDAESIEGGRAFRSEGQRTGNEAIKGFSNATAQPSMMCSANYTMI